MESKINQTWQQYEAGREYKRRIGLYETVRKNERFYRGDQWHGSQSDLPRPVFNLIRRIVDFLVGAVLPGDISIHYSDDRLPFIDNTETREAVCRGLALLEKNASYRWKRNHMKELMHRALLDAAISGDGVLYCWWDNQKKSGQPFLGEICTDLISGTDLFVADVNSTDLQAQEYIILAGRASVEALRHEAELAGVPPEEIAKITADAEEHGAMTASDLSEISLSGSEKATYLLKFFREGGEVVFEKSTQNALIKRVHTGLSLYPVAYFNWYPSKKCFHGTAPVSDMIPNQTYVNTAYAMMMKHMCDTAFSKIIYDKSRIPEWSNEVGEAIAAMGGGNVSDAVSVVGVGQMQDGYLELINNVIENTKSMMGATDAALGDEQASNTSAILALQEASYVTLTGINARLCRCIGEIASIWADMLCTYCPKERLIPYEDTDGLHAETIDYAILKGELLRASAETAHIGHYSPAATVSTLNTLLQIGQLDVRQYLKCLPAGSIVNREKILQEIQSKGIETNE